MKIFHCSLCPYSVKQWTTQCYSTLPLLPLSRSPCRIIFIKHAVPATSHVMQFCSMVMKLLIDLRSHGLFQSVLFMSLFEKKIGDGGGKYCHSTLRVLTEMIPWGNRTMLSGPASFVLTSYRPTPPSLTRTQCTWVVYRKATQGPNIRKRIIQQWTEWQTWLFIETARRDAFSRE